MVTPREALASLLAVPYWALALLLGGIAAQVATGACGVHGWAATGAGIGAGLVVGAAAGLAQGRILGALAGWVWARVEILAQEWRELSRTNADIPLTSTNTPDIEADNQ